MEIRNINLNLNLVLPCGGFGVLEASPSQTVCISCFRSVLNAALHGGTLATVSPVKSNFGVCWLHVCTSPFSLLHEQDFLLYSLANKYVLAHYFTSFCLTETVWSGTLRRSVLPVTSGTCSVQKIACPWCRRKEILKTGKTSRTLFSAHRGTGPDSLLEKTEGCETAVRNVICYRWFWRLLESWRTCI